MAIVNKPLCTFITFYTQKFELYFHEIMKINIVLELTEF